MSPNFVTKFLACFLRWFFPALPVIDKIFALLFRLFCFAKSFKNFKEFFTLINLFLFLLKLFEETIKLAPFSSALEINSLPSFFPFMAINKSFFLHLLSL